ncbi:site-specific integrase [Bifidobacterium sp. B4107]|uniref:tyrosine-type recombinase/integrase n=1 Tax=unclassified Bifidobacterium TaxID=2608897 RepID=UPI00226B6413|nr:MULTISPECIES: site-specific integrase [unclassified Bifidobacterium]MCX8648618.1 site-specific integrase [Bifidobacterium sp. B4107]MCX8652768.1 site-specific integrase [Bifidobacterium sp. B4111]MCX8659199.1 site-specific integrase [Bifidobacterium sp. B4114]
MDAAAEAQAWLNDAEKRIQIGIWEPPQTTQHKAKSKRINLGEYFPEWLENRTFKGRSLKAGTKYRLRKDVENHILAWFGNTRLIDITQAGINQWLASMPSDQQAMKANAYKALKSILRTASQPGLHGEPPLIPAYPCTKSLPKPERKSKTVPATPEEVKAIYDAMPERYRMSIYLAVFGDRLRIGEVCALQRRDIDPKTRTLHIRRGRATMDNERLTDTPKTDNSIRDERIPPQLLPLLQQFLDEQVRSEKDAWLFPEREDPTKPIHPNSLRSWYSQARDQAGRPDLRFHDLRHTGLTWLAAEGATIRELMDAAGHADVNTAMRYQHSLDRRKDILAEKLGANLLPDETPELLLARIGRVDEDIAGLERQHADLVARLQEL